jgi:hypothetical protein
MRATVGVVIEFPQMDKLVDRAGICLEIPDQLLSCPPLWSAGKPSSWYSFTASAIAPTRSV